MANRDKVKIDLPVVPKLDRRAAKGVTNDIRELERKLGPVKVSFDALSKTASDSVKALNKVASSAAQMGKTISKVVKKASEDLDGLGRKMGKVKGGRGGSGGGPDDAQEAAVEATEGLTDAIGELNATTRKQVDFTKRAIKQQADFAKIMKAREKEKVGGYTEFVKSIPSLFQKGSRLSALKGMAGGAGKMAGIGPTGHATTAAKAAAGGVGGGAGGAAGAAGAAAGGGAMASAASSLMAAGPYIAAAAATIMVIVKTLQMASESQTKINKAMLAGVGFANDLNASAESYKGGIDELRDAIQDTSSVMMKFGGSSEQTAKIINRFAKESTGSIMQTRNQLSQLPGGLQIGVATLAKAATAYGKALGMEAEDAAAMMGKFTNELGMGTQGAIDTMGDIVRAAANANMPMTKFMDIFHKVIPDVELYQNRIEELTGTVKLLSKTMSAKDVQSFMNAFKNGFKGVDFKQRLKTALVVGNKLGADFIPNALAKDFNAKARSMAKNFADFASPGEDIEKSFMKAMKGGETTMAKFINDKQAVASKQGTQLQGASVSNAMMLAANEKTRQKGGVLNTASAMRGAGEMSTFKILRGMSHSLTQGWDGISEQVMSTLGISAEQVEAMRKMDQTMDVQLGQLNEYGMTNSKSMNEALRETVKLRKTNMSEKEIADAMYNVTQDELTAAAELEKSTKKDDLKAFNLAEAQYNVTTSIGDKIDNVISFLLEQILRVLNPVLDVLNSILDAFLSGDKAKAKVIQDRADIIKRGKEGKRDLLDSSGKKIGEEGTGKFTPNVKGVNEMVDIVASALTRGVGAGQSGQALASSMAKSGAFDAKSLQALTTEDVITLAQRAGGSGKDILNKFQGAQKRGDVEGMLKSLDALPDMDKSIMSLTRLMAEKGIVTQSGMERAEGRGQFSRPGAAKSAEAAELIASSKAANEARITQGIQVLDKDPKRRAEAQASLEARAAAELKKAGVSDGSATSTSMKTGSPETKEAIRVQADQAKVVDQQLKVQEDVYEGISDVASILKKGIRYESSWMGGKYRNVLKEATLYSFRQALLEFAALSAKMDTDKNFKEKMGSQSWNVMQSGKSMKDLASIKGDDSAAWNKAMGYDAGGSINFDQMARVHKGEYVVPRGGALVQTGGVGGGKTVNVNAVINVQSEASAEQIRAEVHNLYRSH